MAVSQLVFMSRLMWGPLLCGGIPACVHEQVGCGGHYSAAVSQVVFMSRLDEGATTVQRYPSLCS